MPTIKATANSRRVAAPMTTDPTRSIARTGMAEVTLVLMDRMATRFNARFMSSA